MLLGRVGRAGLPGAVWCASPFPLAAMSFCFAWPPPGWVCPGLGPFAPRFFCALAFFVSPGWPLVAAPPPPPPSAVFVVFAQCLGFFLFFFPPLLLCAPVLSGVLWFLAPGALGLGAVFCLLCWPSTSRLSVRSRLFCASAWPLAAPWWLLPPPPPPPTAPLCVSRFLVAAARCCVPCAVLCCLSLGAVLRRAAALCAARCCELVCSVAVLRPFGAAACCAVPSGAARRPGALRFALLCFAVFPWPMCSVLCVFCHGVVVRAVVCRCALCCVCPGVPCCAFPVLSALCGTVLCCAGALALCCLCGACCCWRLVLCCAAVRCAVSFGVLWCGAGSGGPWLSAGGVFRCRCPCLTAWSASLWLVWCAVVPCFPVSCAVVLCCRVLLCCCVLLSCCVAVGACFALLGPVVLCCVVLLVGCAVFISLPGGGVRMLWRSFPRAVRFLSSPPCALRCLGVLAVVPCFPVSCAEALCCCVVLCCRALLSFCGAVFVCFALLWPVVRRRAVLCCAVGCLCCFAPGGGVCVLSCPFPPCRHAQKTSIILHVTPRWCRCRGWLALVVAVFWTLRRVRSTCSKREAKASRVGHGREGKVHGE